MGDRPLVLRLPSDQETDCRTGQGSRNLGKLWSTPATVVRIQDLRIGNWSATSSAQVRRKRVNIVSAETSRDSEATQY